MSEVKHKGPLDREDDFNGGPVNPRYIPPRAAEEITRLLDVIESCFSVGEIRFGTNGLATTVRGKVMDVLIQAGRIDGEGRPTLHADDSRTPAGNPRPKRQGKQQ